MEHNAIRSKIVRTRLNEQERSWLEVIARREHRTMSNTVRLAIIEAAARRGLTMEEGGAENGDKDGAA